MVRTFHVCTVLTLSELCPQIAKRNQGLYPEFWASSCFIIALPQHVAKDRNQGACQTIALCTSWSCVCPVQLPAFCFPPINATNPITLPPMPPTALRQKFSPLPCCWGLSWQALIDPSTPSPHTPPTHSPPAQDQHLPKKIFPLAAASAGLQVIPWLWDKSPPPI